MSEVISLVEYQRGLKDAKRKILDWLKSQNSFDYEELTGVEALEFIIKSVEEGKYG